jgi:hypothetical protein
VKVKDILIFGTGLAGRAIYRTIKNNSTFNILGFLDNNQTIQGNTYDGKPIYSLDELPQLKFDTIAIGGVWSEQMQKQLLALYVPKEMFWIFNEEEIIFFSQNREKTTDNIISLLHKVLVNLHIPYIIDGSSLLTLLRQKSLSEVSDVDIALLNYSHLELLSTKLLYLEELQEFDVKIIRYNKNRVSRNKGNIAKIIVCSKDNPIISEPVIIDISTFNVSGNYLTLDYGDSYFYFPKELLDSQIEYPYKNIHLSIPLMYEKYLECVYGANWIERPKKWSSSDYKNLVNEVQLKQLSKN